MRSPRRSLGLALFAVAFGTNVATPLFLIYETHLDLSRWMVTALFAIYPIGLAPALTYAGPASDVLGRKRLMVGGLLLSGVASTVMLAGADSVGLLLVGRLVLGAATGITLVAASAWMQELDPADPLPPRRARRVCRRCAIPTRCSECAARRIAGSRRAKRGST